LAGTHWRRQQEKKKDKKKKVSVHFSSHVQEVVKLFIQCLKFKSW
jgi:hypothetical protein